MAVRLLIGCSPQLAFALDLSWTQYSDSAELPMSAKWRDDMRAKLLSLKSDTLSAKEKIKRTQLLRRLGPEGAVRPEVAKSVLYDCGEIVLIASVLFSSVAGIWYFKVRSLRGDNVSSARASVAAAIAKHKGASNPPKQGELPQSPAKLTGDALAIALGAVLDELGLQTLEELGEELVPAGKHQGDSFQAVLEDVAFCKFICKEPRKGWMGMLKTYIEAAEERQPKSESAPLGETTAPIESSSYPPAKSITTSGVKRTSAANGRKNPQNNDRS